MLRINYANVRRNSWAEIGTVRMFLHKNKVIKQGERERDKAA